MSLKSFLGGIKLRGQKNRMQTETVQFPGALVKNRHILVCLPGGLRELTLLKQFLPDIKALFKPAEITLLALPGVKVNDMYPRKGFHILSPSTDQVTWSGLPKKSYVKMLQDYKFDVLLDLNLQPSTFTSSILLNFPGAIRIGRGNHLGDPYYNLEIKTRYLRDERNIYRSLLQTLGTLKAATGRGCVPNSN